MGLWLSEDAKADPLQDGVIFNFEKRALANDAKGWTNDTPSRAGWDVDFKDGTASVTHAGTVSKMLLDPGRGADLVRHPAVHSAAETSTAGRRSHQPCQR